MSHGAVIRRLEDSAEPQLTSLRENPASLKFHESALILTPGDRNIQSDSILLYLFKDLL
ncbi:predicted protein [Sclerotinia sclerotiorum 1980 UF-70]|uniref:Uncharacterized protein n=1 Tax=Sclerotinia sclerotiorum (strain ATCC 18683 / 1980 / Ss-1) TaxID=665079 RepID=A7EUT2_SCLS1|nr:predicted protein [Sclerotinia sclerotiorum 1980 UF-70]EDN93224.1 predicted protein [Sclerotinia sclerotiorum 1980 UF-70]